MIILALQTVQANSNVQLKDSIQDKIVILYIWTFSDIHSSHMMQKMIGIDKRYSSSGVSYIDIHLLSRLLYLRVLLKRKE